MEQVHTRDIWLSNHSSVLSEFVGHFTVSIFSQGKYIYHSIFVDFWLFLLSQLVLGFPGICPSLKVKLISVHSTKKGLTATSSLRDNEINSVFPRNSSRSFSAHYSLQRGVVSNHRVLLIIVRQRKVSPQRISALMANGNLHLCRSKFFDKYNTPNVTWEESSQPPPPTTLHLLETDRCGDGVS